MTRIITLLAIVELSFFFVYDLISSKGNRTRRYAIRMSSCLGGVVLAVCELVFDSPYETRELAADLSCAAAVLVMYPCSFEKPKSSLLASLCLLSFTLMTLFVYASKPKGTLDYRFQRVAFSFAPMFLFVLVYFFRLTYKRFSAIRAMFRNTAVWHNVEEYARFIYSMIYLVAGVMLLSAIYAVGHLGDVLSVVTALLYMALYAVLYLRAMTGRTFIIPSDTEERIKDIIKGNLRSSYAEKVDDDRKMNNLYRRVVMYMEEKRPYLDQTFDMSSLADRMFTNKLYLSKTINILSGRNFRQFVNFYRVRRAIELLKTDPRLKMGEVSEMSGFHSSVSFNMSFKVNTGKTPSEWLQDYLRELERK